MKYEWELTDILPNQVVEYNGETCTLLKNALEDTQILTQWVLCNLLNGKAYVIRGDVSDVLRFFNKYVLPYNSRYSSNSKVK